MRPPNVRAPRPPGGKQLRTPEDRHGSAIRPLDRPDIEAILQMPRPTRWRLVVFDAKGFV